MAWLDYVRHNPDHSECTKYRKNGILPLCHSYKSAGGKLGFGRICDLYVYAMIGESEKV